MPDKKRSRSESPDETTSTSRSVALRMEQDSNLASQAKHHGGQRLEDTSASNSQICSNTGKQTYFCAKCASINLDRIFSTNAVFAWGDIIADLEATVSELEDSDCSLCNLFASIAPKIKGTEKQSNFRLRKFSAGRVFLGLETKQFVSPGQETRRFVEHDVSVLGVTAPKTLVARSFGFIHLLKMEMPESLSQTSCSYSDYHSKTSPVLKVREICAEKFDVSFVRECLNYCQKTHVKSYVRKVADLIVPFFKVIDCNTGKVIAAPSECQYAALSYVWSTVGVGGTTIIPNDLNILAQNNYPQLILDSMSIVLKMGLCYLWVDRYCINQQNAVEQHTQVRQMDLIYANAFFTIISAATESRVEGLRGVSKLRKMQPKLAVGEKCLISTLPSGIASVEQSVWAIRGWTYQEGILSKRRLIFTDYQLFFECNGMHCAESTILPLSEMHDSTTGVSHKDVPVGPIGYKILDSNPFSVVECISDFSKRNLTFPEDKINAMRGIFHTFERAAFPVYHNMGVPIFPPVRKVLSWGPLQEIKRTYEHGFLIGLTWHNSGPGVREPLFPSWSWAGWSGIVNKSLLGEGYINFGISQFGSLRDPKIWTEFEDGTLSRLPDANALPAFFQKAQVCNFIHIEAHVLSILNWSLIRIEAQYVSSTGGGDKIQLELKDKYYFSHPIYWDKKSPERDLLGKNLLGVCMGSLMDYEHYPNPGTLAVIYIVKVGNHYERVGAGEIEMRAAIRVQIDGKVVAKPILELVKENVVWRKVRIG